METARIVKWRKQTLTLVARGNFSQAYNFVDQLLQVNTLREDEEPYLIYLKTLTLNRLQSYNKTIELLSPLISDNLKLKFPLLYIDMSLNLITALFIKGNNYSNKVVNDLEDLKAYMSSIEAKIPTNRMLKRKGKFNFVYGTIEFYKGRYKESKTLFFEALKIAQDIDDVDILTDALNGLGNYYYSQGKFLQALQCYQNVLDILVDNPDVEKIARAHSNMSVIFETQGELDLALEHQKQSIVIREKIGGTERANSYHVLGRIYYSKGDLESAIHNFELAHKITQTSEVKRTFSVNSFFLIQALVEKNLIESAEAHLKTLKADTESTFKSGNVIIALGESLILKSHKNLKDLAKAQAILQRLIEEGNMNKFLTGMTFLHLTEIFLIELQLFYQPEVFEKIKNNINDLIEIATKQKSSRLLIQAKLIASQVALIEYNFEEAERSLQLAGKIADEKGLRNLSILVSKLYDEFITQITRDRDYIKGQVSFKERVKHSHLNDLLQSVLKRRISNKVSEVEKPILFMISTIDNFLLYTYEFNKKSVLPATIQELLQYANIDSSEVDIQRYNFKNFKVIVKRFEGLKFYYAYIGQSYSASMKLDIFVDTLKAFQTVWMQLMSAQSSLHNYGSELITKIIYELYYDTKLSENDKEIVEIPSSINNHFKQDIFQESLAGLPAKLSKYKIMLNPVRLIILKLLYQNFKMSAVDLRNFIGITWGSWSSHISTLEKAGLIETRREFINETPRVMVLLKEEGSKQYLKLREVLYAI